MNRFRVNYTPNFTQIKYFPLRICKYKDTFYAKASKNEMNSSE